MTINKTLRNVALSGLVAITLGTAGCAKFWDQANANGGVFASTKAPYIVVNQSGGEIMDVYKLENAIMQTEESGSGWLFVDAEGRAVHLGGDMKSIRLNSVRDPIWDMYHEYHMEFENKTYRQKFGEINTSN